MDESAFPSESKEHRRCLVRISENVSDFKTFKVLSNDTLGAIHQSNICSARDPTAKNLHLDLLNEDFPKIVKSLRQPSGKDVYSPASDHGEMDAHMQNLNDENATPMNVSNTSTPPMAVVDPHDPVGCTFLMDECDDGQCFCVKIVKCTCNHDATVGNCDSVPSMSAATWEHAAVQVYGEWKDFSIALALDMNGVSEIGFNINGADIVVTSLAIEREECVISSITDQPPFLV